MKPWTQDGFRTSWGKHFSKIEEIKQNRLVFHGPRKTTCTKLAEADSSSEEIQSVTGQRRRFSSLRRTLDEQQLENHYKTREFRGIGLTSCAQIFRVVSTW